MSGSGSTRCECGAAAPCIDIWHEALAAEQADPAMYTWHTPLVCAFILQHRSHTLPRFADEQFRMLQFYADRGIEETNRLTRHQVARNKTGSGYDMEPSSSYAALPAAGFPTGFPLGVHDLVDADGGFVGDGYQAYGDRMHRLAEATIRAWLGL